MLFAQLNIQGTVQGVGFRPFVWQLAQALNLKGWVLNHAQGVDIFLRLLGSSDQAHALLEKLRHQLQTQAPPLAKVEQIQTHWLDQDTVKAQYSQLLSCEDFQIHTSQNSNTMHTTVPADAATCAQCLAEINDPSNRRYRYPFTNCTHCGPRFSIIHAMPYDRHHTSMVNFPLCSRCEQEYQDPSNRRFHAQPNACPECGPQLDFYATSGEKAEKSCQNPQSSLNKTAQNSHSEHYFEIIEQTCQQLLAGKIIAIKGIGGFHLVCDAENDFACQQLRQRKNRPRKPFALMAPDLNALQLFAHCPPVAEQALTSAAAPIVLLPRKKEAPPLSKQVAPNQSRLGIMLPSNPLHHLLMQQWQTHKPKGLLVFTSANLSGQPQIYQDQAVEDLNVLADWVLTHNRPILRRLEDSVVTLNAEQTQIVPLRLARGYTPLQLPLPPSFNPLNALASGGDLKNSLAFQKGNTLTLLHFLGDLENYEVQTAYRQAIDDLQQLYDFQPDELVVDKHPSYYSAQALQTAFPQLATDPNKTHSVQHHHAHLSAVLLEHQLPLDTPPVMGIILDGLGYGSDGALWGGELLYGGYQQVQRLAHLAPFPLFGGDKASKEPWRSAYALLKPLGDLTQLQQRFPNVEALQQLQNKPLPILKSMLQANLNCPLTSSTGRLFDAVSALCGLHFEAISFEGEAAMALENLLTQASLEAQRPFGYPLPLKNGQLQTTPMIEAILNDLNAQEEAATVSARFHIGLVQGLLQAALSLQADYPFTQIALSGGVCQNQRLIWLFEQLCPQSITLLTHQILPANDQSLAVGQLAAITPPSA